MFEKGMHLIHYKLGLVRVEDIAYNSDLGGLAYYLISESGKKDFILVNEKSKQVKLREVTSKAEMENIIAKQNMFIDRLIKNKKEREHHYIEMSLYGSFKDLLITVKRYKYLLEQYYPTYISQKEHQIYAFAKDKLCEEASFVLNMKQDEVLAYIFKADDSKKKEDEDDGFFVL